MQYKDIPRGEDGEIQIEQVEFPIVYPLLSSISVDGSELTEVSFREPTVRDIEICQNEKRGLPTVSRLLTLIAELSPTQIKSMGSRDFSRIEQVISSFL